MVTELNDSYCIFFLLLSSSPITECVCAFLLGVYWDSYPPRSSTPSGQRAMRRNLQVSQEKKSNLCGGSWNQTGLVGFDDLLCKMQTPEALPTRRTLQHRHLIKNSMLEILVWPCYFSHYCPCPKPEGIR